MSASTTTRASSVASWSRRRWPLPGSRPSWSTRWTTRRTTTAAALPPGGDGPRRRRGRHADHRLQRLVVLRSGPDPDPARRGRRPALGRHHRDRRVPLLLRDQAHPHRRARLQPDDRRKPRWRSEPLERSGFRHESCPVRRRLAVRQRPAPHRPRGRFRRALRRVQQVHADGRPRRPDGLRAPTSTARRSWSPPTRPG